MIVRVTFLQVQKNNYLGIMIMSNERSSGEIKRRIGRVKTAFQKNRILLTNNKISVKTKNIFIKTYLWSTL